ncbi:heterokaryon incompatibility protein-domain-containing protein [Aspergillus ambiguus]|uniref:heterokaryon incompatibility protein-domain-containing protein n=1 Tax=Aspergillus ambiguus TaxID=176160 RepID=UPI003CCD58B3
MQDVSETVPGLILYQYSPLPPGPNNIRMLCLLPDPNNDAPIRCRLFDYSLSEERRGGHLYEALSYVWGGTDNPQTIFIDDQYLTVTANLREALLHLRDSMIERAMWIDAICINQGDLKERGEQVQLMAKIYSNAARVIVWLGQPSNYSDMTLEAIRSAASEGTLSQYEASLQEGMDELLGRSWFRRIWVLQEVAAARQVQLHCGFMELDGYTFSAGLRVLGHQYPGLMAMQRLVAPVVYILGRAIFRPRAMPSASTPGSFSLNIRPLSELIEMYNRHEATERHDKIFALLGMSSDNPISAGLIPNYALRWTELLRQTIVFLLGSGVFAETWEDRELAIIEGKGVVIGKVSRVNGGDTGDNQDIEITSTGASGSPESKHTLSLQRLSNPVREDDIVCLLSGARKPSIVRLCKDYFTIVRIQAAMPLDVPKNPTMHEFLLLWDWEGSEQRSSEHSEYKTLVESLVSPRIGTHLHEMDRLWHAALISHDAGEFRKSSIRVQDSLLAYTTELGEEDPRTLTCMHKAADLHMKQDEMESAVALFSRVVKLARKRQELDEITFSSLSTLATIYRAQGRWREARKLRVMEDIINLMRNGKHTIDDIRAKVTRALDNELLMLIFEREGDNVQVTEDLLSTIAQDPCGVEMMEVVLDHKGREIHITDAVIAAAARNVSHGEAIIKLLIERRGNEIQLSEKVLLASVENLESGGEIIKLLLDQGKGKIVVDEAVVIAATLNASEDLLKILMGKDYGRIQITRGAQVQIASKCDKEFMKMLLEKEGERFRPTEDILIAAAGSRHGRGVLHILFEERGDDIKITDGVVAAAAGHKHGEGVIRLLLQRRRNEVELTEKVVAAAARSQSGKDIMKLLLGPEVDRDKLSDNVVVEIAKYFDTEIMSLLLDSIQRSIEITEETIVATLKNQHGEDILRFLFCTRRHKVHVRDDAVVQVAKSCSHEMMKLLLDETQHPIKLTNATLIAAARNRGGHSMLMLLLSRTRDKLQVSEELVIEAVRKGREALRVLLDERAQEFHITEHILVAAAGHWYGKELLALLFERKPGEIEITAKVLNAAAGSKRSKEVVEFLVNLAGAKKEDSMDLVASQKPDGSRLQMV